MRSGPVRGPVSVEAGGHPYDDEPRQVLLAVGGMTCGACAARVERAISKLDGASASVNYATGRASVLLPRPHPGQPVAGAPGVRQVLDAVARTGFCAQLLDPGVRRPPSTTTRVSRVLWARFFVALALFVPLGDLSLGTAFVPAMRFPGWQWALLAMAAPIATWCAWPFYRAALRAARHATTTMDTLVSVGILAASALSLDTLITGRGLADASARGWALLWHPSGAVYLDVVAGITLFVLIGRILEAQARARTTSALHLLASAGAREVTVLGAGGDELRIPADELVAGDVFVTRPGEVIATDGTVTAGRAFVDASAMTGESVPISAGVGDAVAGGTIALDGRLLVRADAVGADTQLSHLVELVEAAQVEKSAAQGLADRISGVFVPVVLVLAALTLAGWAVWGPSGSAALNAGLSVVVIACPCALGLATPTALLAGSGRGAQLGIYLKGHAALEAARAIDTVVLDKTGTVTTGRMAVVDTWLAGAAPAGEHARVLALAGAVEDASEHAIARALAAAARAVTPVLPAVEDFCARAGLGASGRVQGHLVLIGSARLLEGDGIALPGDLVEWLAQQRRAGRVGVAVGVDGSAAAGYALSDTLKPSAVAAVSALHDLGLATLLLTGDDAATAHAVAAELGIDPGDVIAGVLPADKAAVIDGLRARGRSVAMVGDGINDAPALARADLGLAVAEGSDIARSAADVLLLRADLLAVPQAVRLARATLRTIGGNLAWAFGYNLAAIPLAAAGLLNPMIAAGAMAVSSLFVLSNSLRLQRFDAAGGQTPARAADDLAEGRL